MFSFYIFEILHNKQYNYLLNGKQIYAYQFTYVALELETITVI